MIKSFYHNTCKLPILLVAFTISNASIALSATNEGKYAEIDGLPQLDFTTYTPQLFWMVVFFVLFYLFYAHKTLPDLSNTIESRKSYIDGYLKQAEELKNKSDIVQKSYHEKLTSAHEHASQAVKDVEQDHKNKVGQFLKDYQSRSEQGITATEQKIDSTKNTIMAEIEEIVQQTSDIAVDKILDTQAALDKKKAA